MKKTARSLAPAEVREALTRNRTVWQRTFAPLRRALAGSWRVERGVRPVELVLDAEGGFTLRNESAGLTIRGRYELASAEGGTYIVLDSATDHSVLKIEQLSGERMSVSWAGDDPDPLVFQRERRTVPVAAPVQFL